jgi:hypothetical protein
MPNQAQDLTGQTFGRLRVISREGGGGRGKSPKWLCQCVCGTAKIVTGHSLRAGQKSCGCLHREKLQAYYARMRGKQIFSREKRKS